MDALQEHGIITFWTTLYGTLCVLRPDGPFAYLTGTGSRRILCGVFFICFFSLALLPVSWHIAIWILWRARLMTLVGTGLEQESLQLLCPSDWLDEGDGELVLWWRRSPRSSDGLHDLDDFVRRFLWLASSLVDNLSCERVDDGCGCWCLRQRCSVLPRRDRRSSLPLLPLLPRLLQPLSVLQSSSTMSRLLDAPIVRDNLVVSSIVNLSISDKHWVINRSVSIDIYYSTTINRRCSFYFIFDVKSSVDYKSHTGSPISESLTPIVTLFGIDSVLIKSVINIFVYV